MLHSWKVCHISLLFEQQLQLFVILNLLRKLQLHLLDPHQLSFWQGRHHLQPSFWQQLHLQPSFWQHFLLLFLFESAYLILNFIFSFFRVCSEFIVRHLSSSTKVTTFFGIFSSLFVSSVTLISSLPVVFVFWPIFSIHLI